ncbi:hypothetical protein [Brevibacterium sp. FAM 24638]|uniref:hypothetical protein n=1 Tax=Brevibacterium sp. FAM 24638 TaxID=3415681 RepID=UPI003C7E0070
MKLSSLSSPIADTGFAAHDRVDPFYDGLWTHGSQGLWTRFSEAKAQHEAGLVRLPKYLDIGKEEAMARVTITNQWGLKLAFLSALDAYRTVTAEQMVALTGAKFHLSHGSPFVPGMFASGLIDMGRVSSALAPGRAGTLGHLYRPSRTTSFDRDLAPHMTYPELVSVTGGQPWTSGGLYDRHNTLSTELMLRLAEYTDIATMLGEKFSTFDMLFGSGVGRKPIESGRRGDGVIIRPDGVRVVMEVTASMSPDSFNTKVRRWAEYFDAYPYESNGVVVCFVIANPTQDMSSHSKVARNSVKRALRKAASQNPGFGRTRSRHRMLFTDWQDWFPARGEVSTDFLDMIAYRPSAEAHGPDEECSMLLDDSLDLPNPTFEPLAVVDNAAGLRQTPLWLRAGKQPTQIVDTEVEAAGLADHPALEPDRRRTRFGQTLPPPRLRTITHNLPPRATSSKQWADYRRLIEGEGA